MEKPKIDSLRMLALRLSQILQSLSASPQLALAVTDNPVRTIEKMGYQLSSEMRSELVRKLRFDPDTATRVLNLSQTLVELGSQVEENIRREIQHKLVEELAVGLAQAHASIVQLESEPGRHGAREGSPAEELSDLCCLDASSKEIADLDLYRKIRNGNIPPLTRGIAGHEKGRASR